jgi:hypothetical protein
MKRYVWSTCLLLLWCRCELASPFLSGVLCHKLGQSTFHLYQRRAEGSDPFLWAEGVPGAEMHRRISVQYSNSVVSLRMVYERIESFKNGRTSIKHEEGTKLLGNCAAHRQPLYWNFMYHSRIVLSVDGSVRYVVRNHRCSHN